MKKKFKLVSLFMAIILVCGVLSACGCQKKDSGVNVKPDDPAMHGNGMEPLPTLGEDGNYIKDLMPGDPRQEYSLQCRFEGKMDENSFEVTELDYNQNTEEWEDGPLLQMRVGNDSVRESINTAEIGARAYILCSYNEDSQLIAKGIIIAD